jgi:hypothetical protein
VIGRGGEETLYALNMSLSFQTGRLGRARDVQIPLLYPAYFPY